ncbi:MAG: hypothetical protein HBSIN01_11560 [Candidatus Brocadia sinica]|nr:MAG: hypothetical protein HBSIN01_11560 [Candidatus Brocadia sinica]
MCRYIYVGENRAHFPRHVCNNDLFTGICSTISRYRDVKDEGNIFCITSDDDNYGKVVLYSQDIDDL